MPIFKMPIFKMPNFKVLKAPQLPKWTKYECGLKSDDEKLSDLYEACFFGRDDIVKLLADIEKIDVNKISPEEKDCQGLSALHITARHNQLECMKVLLEYGADVNIEDSFGFRPIHDAALYGHIECVQELLTNGALTTGVSDGNLDHVTPLFYAAQQNHLECVKLLMKRSTSDDYYLMWDISSKRGNVEITAYATQESLINRSVHDWMKNSALSGHVKYIDRMREMIHRKFDENESIQSLHSAVQHGHLEYVETLLKCGIDPNIHDKDNITALHYAARFGQADCITILTKYGAKTDCRTFDNLTPLHLAVRQGLLEGVIALLQCGANVNEKGGDCDDTPLHMLLKDGGVEDIMKELIKYKPDLTIMNKGNQKPADVVSEYKRLNDLLLEYARN